MKRSKFREFLVSHITDLVCEHPIRVGIDGIDGVGKTRLAEELIVPLEKCGRPVIRASIDGFHNSRAVRYRRGRESPEGQMLYFQECDPHKQADIVVDYQDLERPTIVRTNLRLNPTDRS